MGIFDLKCLLRCTVHFPVLARPICETKRNKKEDGKALSMLACAVGTFISKCAILLYVKTFRN